MRRVNVVMIYKDVVTVKFSATYDIVNRIFSAIERELGVCRHVELSVLPSVEEVKDE